MNGSPQPLIKNGRKIALRRQPLVGFTTTSALARPHKTGYGRSMQRPHVWLHPVAAAIVCLLPWGAPAADPALAAAAPTPGWFAYAPAADRFDTNSALDLRGLNEQFAGEHGFIGVKNGAFVHRANGQPVRFWAVNGPPHELRGDDLRGAARLLARYGVNLVRVHGALFDKDGETDPAKIRRAQEIALAMKAEGIYTLFSVYFPLWLTPRPDHPWLKGYDGKKHPFAVLMFNPEFQARHRAWLEALLTTPAEGGRPLLEEPVWRLAQTEARLTRGGPHRLERARAETGRARRRTHGFSSTLEHRPRENSA
jgi:hypothetical protein